MFHIINEIYFQHTIIIRSGLPLMFYDTNHLGFVYLITEWVRISSNLPSTKLDGGLEVS